MGKLVYLLIYEVIQLVNQHRASDPADRGQELQLMLTSIIRIGGVKCDLCDFNYGMEETAGARKTGSIISETEDLLGISIEFAQNGAIS